jgi:hypothetical protein
VPSSVSLSWLHDMIAKGNTTAAMAAFEKNLFLFIFLEFDVKI